MTSGREAGQSARAPRADGTRTRAAILDAAVDVAAVAGLEGLSIGDLARAVGMSKSGLYAHFKSKEALQLATVDAARQLFIDEVVVPALNNEDPLEQLRELGHGFVRHVRRKHLAGGCFFVGAAAEVGPRDGPVRDRVAAVQREWSDFLRVSAEGARGAGRLSSTIDPQRLAIRLGALLAGGNLVFVLQRDPGVLDEMEIAIDDLLASEGRSDDSQHLR